MLKKIFATAAAILLVLLAAGILGIKIMQANWFKEKPLVLKHSTPAKPMQFCWSSRTYGDYTEKHNAILIPVKLAGFTQRFYLQFDTGAPTTMIYGNSLASLRENGLTFNEVEKGDEHYLEQLDLMLGGNVSRASNIKILKDYGREIQLGDSTTEITLGTIGTDFIANRILLIDFKNEFLQLYDERTDWMASLPDFAPFDFKGRRMMLPAKIGKKQLELLYDSGTSAFGLVTSKKRYKAYSDDERKEIKYSSNNKDQKIPICHKSTEEMIWIGNAELPLQRISYVDMYANLQGLISPFTRIGGWLGNKAFIEKAIIFDTKVEEFLVIESAKNDRKP